MNFPLYRKLSHNKTFYRINSLTDFDEIMLIGKRVKLMHTEALQYPEKLKILDMVHQTDSAYLAMEQNEWDNLFSQLS